MGIETDFVSLISRHCYRVELAGSVRRKVPSPRDIDVVCIPKDWSELTRLFEHLGQTLRTGPSLHSFIWKRVQVDVYPTTYENWGAMLLYLTGPAQYNIGMRRIAKQKGLLLNQTGLYQRLPGDIPGKLIASETEEAIYQALGKTWTPPELRGT